MKVFCIGFHKTGTTSLGSALEILGYNVCGTSRELESDLLKNNMNSLFEKVRKYDAFQDNPWPIYYKELDEYFPKSKFILTIRDEEKWISSVVKHFGDQDTIMREIIYGHGHPLNHEDVYIERYRKHNKEVKDYFSERPNDILILSLENGDGWEMICEFLNKKIPDIEFPHLNKASNRSVTIKKTSIFKWLLRK